MIYLCKMTEKNYQLYETISKAFILIMLIVIFYQENIQQSYLVS